MEPALMSELLKAAPAAAGALLPAMLLKGINRWVRVAIVPACALVGYFIAEPAAGWFGNGSPKASGVIIGVFMVPVFRKALATIEALDLAGIVGDALRQLFRLPAKPPIQTKDTDNGKLR